MLTPSFILVGGQKGNGKDTLADLLMPYLPTWTKTHFSHQLKLDVANRMGVTLGLLEAWKNNPLPPPGWRINVRTMLQRHGELYRSCNPHVWAASVSSGFERALVCDWRHLEEAEFFQDLHSIQILVCRPGHENDDPHPSEQNLSELRRYFIARGVRGPTGHPLCHYFVVNDGEPRAMLEQLSPLLDLFS